MKPVITLLTCCITLTLPAQQVDTIHPDLHPLITFTVEQALAYEKVADLWNEPDWDYSEQPPAIQALVDSVEEERGPATDGVTCSYYCSNGPDTIFASSTLDSNPTYGPDQIHDWWMLSGWSPTGDGIGEYITFQFSEQSAPIHTIEIWNGYHKNTKLWRKNARVKELALVVNGSQYAVLQLADVQNSQHFSLPNLVTLFGNEPVELTFEILSTYPGTKYQDVVISEINFDGIHH